MFRSFIVLMAVLCVAGCAEFDAAFSAANGYAAAQITSLQKNVQGANDNIAQSWSDVGCGLPYGVVARGGPSNRGFAAAVVALCGAPAGFTLTAAPVLPLTVGSPPAQ